MAKTPSQILQELKATLDKGGTAKAKLHHEGRLQTINRYNWSKLDGPLEVPYFVLEQAADALLESIRKSTLEFFTKRGHTGWNEEGTSNIYDAYQARITKEGLVQILTDWPGFQLPEDEKQPSRFVADAHGTIIIETLPFKLGDGVTWIHPSFAKKNFIQKGLENGKKQMINMVSRHFENLLTLGDPLK